MAICKFPKSKGRDLKATLTYVLNHDKTDDILINGKDIFIDDPYTQMMGVKSIFGKEEKNKYRQCLHFVQAFHPDDNLTHIEANEIGMKLAEYYKNYQVLVVTHTNTKHKHNHFVVNSVSHVDGKMVQMTPQDLQNIKDLSDSLCREYGLSVIEHPQRNSDISKNEYHVALKMESWKYKLISAIDNALDISATKNEFIQNIKAQGYDINWSDNRKNITYTTPDGKKCRDNKLHDNKYLKEMMENEFNTRKIKGFTPRRNSKSTTKSSNSRFNTTNSSSNEFTTRQNARNKKQYGNQYNNNKYGTGSKEGNELEFSRNKKGQYRKITKSNYQEKNYNNTNNSTDRNYTRYRNVKFILSLIDDICRTGTPHRYHRKTRKCMPEKGTPAYKELMHKLKFSSSIQWEDEEIEM